MKAIFSLALLALSLTARAADAPGTEITGACGGSDGIAFSKAIPDEWKEVLMTLPESGFDQYALATALREKAATPEARTLGEYLMGRAYYEAKLFHLAHSQFLAVASMAPAPQTAGVIAASFECLTRINQKFPSLNLTPAAMDRLAAFPAAEVSVDARKGLWKAAFMAARTMGGAPADDPRFSKLVGFLSQAGGLGSFARALWAEKKGDYALEIKELKTVLASSPRPDAVATHLDLIYMMLGHAQYTLGQYKDAANSLVNVPRDSNMLAQALSDLTWAYLMDHRYKEAVGTAVNLQKTNLRKAFAPEAPMVMSMALNELCQYPQAIRSVQHFRKQYEKPYRFLYQWQQAVKSGKGMDMYHMLVAHLNGKPTLPAMIATEWIRSPVFVSLQEEVNLLQEEKRDIVKLLKPLGDEKKVLADREKELRAQVADLQQRIKEERSKSRTLSSDLSEELRKMKVEIALFKYRKAAIPTWQRNLASLYREIPARDQTAVARINADLGTRNGRLVRQLLGVAQNTQLVEIEIYDGASEDMVWLNAHPDYQQKVKQFKQDTAKQDVSSWNWGKVSFDMENEEVWEDELGWFKGEVGDECSNRDRYLKLQELEK